MLRIIEPVSTQYSTNLTDFYKPNMKHPIVYLYAYSNHLLANKKSFASKTFIYVFLATQKHSKCYKVNYDEKGKKLSSSKI